MDISVTAAKDSGETINLGLLGQFFATLAILFTLLYVSGSIRVGRIVSFVFLHVRLEINFKKKGE